MIDNESTTDIQPKMSLLGFWAAVVFTVAVIFSGITAGAFDQVDYHSPSHADSSRV